MKVVIPAAGLGTRFAALRLDIPKELLPLGGTPVIGHALTEAARAGFAAAIVVVSPAKEQLRQFLVDSRLPMQVEIVIQDRPLGIGDAVLKSWQGEPVGVLLPDDVVLGSEHWTKLTEIYRQTGAATLCVRPVPVEQSSRFGIAECDGDRVTNLIEKPSPGSTQSNLAIFGRYVVTEAVIDGLRGAAVDGELELTSGLAAACASPKGVRAVWFGREIYDCGTPAEYQASLRRFPPGQA